MTRDVIGGARGVAAELAVAAGCAGWRWPGVAPLLVALVLLPVAYCVLTPTRHVVKALDASARTFVTSAAASVGVVAMFVEWPTVLRAASALAAVVHGIVLPLAAPAWSTARRRLGRLPAATPWGLAAVGVLVWHVAGW